MKNRYLAAFVLSNLAIAPAMAASEAVEKAAIMTVANDMTRMYEHDDLAIWERVYSKDFAGGPLIIDAVVNPWAKEVTVGHADYKKQFEWYAKGENFYSSKPKDYRQAYSDPVIVLRGNMATFVAPLDASWANDKGGRDTLHGRYTLIFVKQGAEWKVWHEHFSFPITTVSAFAGAQ
ncbi:MAG: nuclear transport factor 2 family protein [Novosphingobium sp.]|jgi:ketosteroid isomerase-like protein|nr:nuclear transport factor 2 family protein [Novosphingobium sp.]